MHCLNRTSVGLKLDYRLEHVCVDDGLNRTSVGLKPSAAPPAIPTPLCLNRTSVGLKLRQEHRHLRLSAPEPQSNQRGIETVLMLPGHMSSDQASIEPAWD